MRAGSWLWCAYKHCRIGSSVACKPILLVDRSYWSSCFSCIHYRRMVQGCAWECRFEFFLKMKSFDVVYRLSVHFEINSASRMVIPEGLPNYSELYLKTLNLRLGFNNSVVCSVEPFMMIIHWLLHLWQIFGHRITHWKSRTTRIHSKAHINYNKPPWGN